MARVPGLSRLTTIGPGEWAVLACIPLRTGRGLNSREHWSARSRRVKAEREAVTWALVGRDKPRTPCTVLLTRVAPSNGLDDDNLAGALKAVRDAVATWLQVDDRDRETVRYEYTQRRGAWGVEIEVKSGVAGDASRPA